MDKKTKKIIIIIAFVILALIMLEAIIRLLISAGSKIVEYHEEKVEEQEYQESEEYQEEIYIESCIEKAITLMKSGDYETLYSLLDPMYKEYKNFENFDAFEDYIKDYIGNPQSLELIKYNKSNGRYVCTFKSTNDVGTNTRKVLIEEENDTSAEYNFNIIFDEIYYIKSYDSKCNIVYESIQYSAAYRLKYANYSAYIVKVTNNSKKEIDLVLNDSYIHKSNHEDYKNENIQEALNIKPGETKNIIIKISDSSHSMYEDEYICLNLTIDNKQKEIKINTKKDYFE